MRKQILFTIFFIQTFLKRHFKQIIFASFFGFLATLIIIQAYPIYTKISTKQSIRIGKVGRFTASSIPNDILNLISPGLTNITISGEATPSLVTHWSISNNGTKYTFYLKSNLNWHDGKTFTSKDVNYKIKGANIIPIDDYTLVVQLKEPYAPLPILMSAPLLKNYFIGLGAYKLIKLDIQDEYISELILEPIDRTLPTYIYKFYHSNSDAILAFKLGELDIIVDIEQIEAFKNWENININEITQYNRIIGLFFNLKNNMFRDKEVRQALAYAIPKIENYEKAISPISPLSWAYSTNVRLYSYDPDSAKKILAKNEIASSSSQLILTTYAPLLPVAQQIIDAWNKVGIKAKIKVESSIPADFQIMLIAQAIPPDADQYAFWQSTQELTNITSYNSPKIDKLLEDGRKEIDKNNRKKIYADFQLYLIDDAPAIFLYYPKVHRIEKK